MNIRIVFVALAVLTSGCASQGAWKAYSPVMSNIVGVSATLRSEEIVIGNHIIPMGGKELLVITREGGEHESKITSSEKNAALDVVYKKVALDIGASDSTKISTSANGVSIDLVENWAWMPIDQTFVYGGLRGNSAVIDFNLSKKLSAGKIVVEGVGEVNLSAQTNDTYRAEVSNPKVYYRVQLAKVKQTFSGDKYSNGWITEGDPAVSPLRLSDTANSAKSETWAIKPYQFFWKRWFGSEMPNLTLVVIDSNLFVRSTRGIDSKLLPLAQFERAGRWNERSAYIGDFAVGDFERKFVVLDIKAHREGDSIIIRHARIRYPEVKLEIL